MVRSREGAIAMFPRLFVLATLAGLVTGFGQTNRLRNTDFDRAFLSGGPADGWRTAQVVPGVTVGVRRGAGVAGGAATVIAVAEAVPVTWYTCVQTVAGLPPGTQGVFSVYARTEALHAGSGAYCGLNYYDGRGERITWTDSKQVLVGTQDWTRLVQPFTVPAHTERVVFNLVVHGRGTAFFDRAQVEIGQAVTPWAPREVLAGVAAARGVGRVAILRDDLPVTGTASDPEYLAELVRAAGHECEFLSADQLAERALLDAARVDLLVLPYGSSFPAPAAALLKDYLGAGGSFLAVGGYPFDRLLVRQRGVWQDTRDVVPPDDELRTLLDPGQDPTAWGVGSRDLPEGSATAAAVDGVPCLSFGTAAMPPGGWVTCGSPALAGLPADTQALVIAGRSDQERLPLAVEVVERDGARWRARLDVGRAWKQHAIAVDDLQYWHDNPSVGRGAAGDRPRLTEITALRFGITTEFVSPGPAYRAYVGAVRVGSGRFPAYRNLRVNSHFGGINPATFLVPAADALSVCDAGAPLSDVARLAASPGQTVLPADLVFPGAASGLSATGQTAQGDPGAPLKARWLPLLDAVDRYGRVRGTAFAMMQHFAGEYPGSSWAYSGIADRDLFQRGDAAGAALFRAVLARVIGGAFLFDARAAQPCLRPGEGLGASVRAANLASQARELAVTLTISREGTPVGEQRRVVTVPAHAAVPVEFDLPLPASTEGGLLLLTFALAEAGQPLDSLNSGTVLWSPAHLAAGRGLRVTDLYFDRGQGPRYLLGSQLYWGNGTITGTDPLRWSRQLQAMADSGLAVARSFMNVPGGDSETGWRYRDALVQLAQDRGINLFYAGISWPSTDPQRVAELAKVGVQAAQRYREARGWFIDIVNEPTLPVGAGATDSAEFVAWLQGRYPTLAALREAWGKDLTEAGFEQIKLAPFRGEWASLRAVDQQRFMAAKMRDWARTTRDAVRGVDPERLVSVGYLQGFGDHATVWDPVEATYDLDFANRHYYGDLGGYAAELAQMDMRLLGKPNSTGEFGGTSHPGLAAHFVYQPEADQEWRFTFTAHTAFGLGAAFVASWHWQDPIEDIFPCGLLNSDGAPRDRFYPFRNAALLLGQFRPRYEPPTLWFVLPTAHRFGASRAAVETAMRNSLNALIGLHVSFGTVAEEQVKLLSRPRALVWPVPFCPADETYTALRDAVAAGAALYVSGDLSFDAQRRRTRSERLRELCGVEFVAERYPDTRYVGGNECTAVQAGDLAAALAAVGATGPCIEVKAAGATVLARAGTVPVAVLNRHGQGQVLYVVDPLELHGEPWPVLAAFLRQAGVERFPVTPDLPGIHAHEVSGPGGARARVLLNSSPDAQTVSWGSDLTLDLPSHSGGAALFDAAGTLVAAEAQRLQVAGQTVFAASSSQCLLALDAAPLVRSRALLLLPMGPGRVTLAVAAETELWASVGEVREGRWVEYERLAVPADGLALDAAMAHAWLVIGPRGELDALTQRVPGLLP